VKKHFADNVFPVLPGGELELKVASHKATNTTTTATSVGHRQATSQLSAHHVAVVLKAVRTDRALAF